MMPLAIFIILVFVFTLVSRRLERSVITAPMVFTSVGGLAALCLSSVREPKWEEETFLTVAEIGLVMLLFTDASRTSLKLLSTIRAIPLRLLSVGMLLTIALGGLAALLVYPQLTIWEAGILAAILAPTDAGLGQIIVSSPRVPLRIRQALNVEAGLNDGLSVPFLLFFMAMASGSANHEASSLSHFIIEQLGYGAIIGIGIGLFGGWALGWANANDMISETWRKLGVVTLPMLALLASEVVGASMFIAAFVAGLAVQVRYQNAGRHAVEFAEEWGQLLNLAVFFLFGILVARDFQGMNAAHVVYAVVSLTIVRMLPVAIALLGTRLSRPTMLFMGWFGPRGLASIVLGLVYLEHETGQAGSLTIRMAVMATVLLSIFAHGLSAMPGIAWYAAKVDQLPPGSPDCDTNDAPHATPA